MAEGSTSLYKSSKSDLVLRQLLEHGLGIRQKAASEFSDAGNVCRSCQVLHDETRTLVVAVVLGIFAKIDRRVDYTEIKGQPAHKNASKGCRQQFGGGALVQHRHHVRGCVGIVHEVGRVQAVGTCPFQEAAAVGAMGGV